MVIANVPDSKTLSREQSRPRAVRAGKSQSTAATPSILDLLQCPSCSGVLMAQGSGMTVCKACRKPVFVPDGILDFVAGAASTQLDDIDYDQFYAIDENHASITYNDIRTSAGALWPESFGDALEIGCGTGGFSMAVVAKVPTTRVLLTDVSLKMLAICRRRIEQLPATVAQSIDYATYSGQETCFRPEAFETCFGTAVVHHVLDVPLFLSQVHALLKPGGRAFFMEPNLRFHQALTATLAHLIAGWLPQNVIAAHDMSLMQNWMAEVHCNIVNTGDLDVLIDREDKHLFTSDGFEMSAMNAGFGDAAALACNPDPTGIRTICNYLQQSGVGVQAMRRLHDAWPRAQQAFFSALAPRDSAPSYVFWLQKLPSKGTPASKRASPALQPAALPSARLWMTLALEKRGTHAELVVEGWCLSDLPVKSIQLEIGAWQKRVPIWRPRPDVQTIVNTDGRCSPLHALCSGIDARVPIGPLPTSTTSVTVTVKVVPVDGPSIERGQVTLEPDGPSSLIN